MSGRGKYKSMGASFREGQEQGGGGRGRGRGGNRYRKTLNGNYIKQGGDDNNEENNRPQLLEQREADALEAVLGWPLFTAGEDRLGWLMNFTTTSFEDKETGQVISAVDCYFQCQDGSMFKARVPHAPYFYLQIKGDAERDVEAWLRRKYEGRIRGVEVVYREDLDLKNHLSGLQRKLLKLSFYNVQQLIEVRRDITPTVNRNSKRSTVADAVAALAQQEAGAGGSGRPRDVLEYIEGMREYDVPYHVRFAIDTGVRAGHWFTVKAQDGVTTLQHRPDLLQRAEPVICAFDIETTKLPLRFPNSAHDQVFMISYMIDRKGFLIVNRDVVGADISDFEYTPKPEYDGPFTVINTPDEVSLLQAWFQHMRQVKPGIFVTYNGDYFDFPFIEARAAVHGLDMAQEIGFKIASSGECLSKAAVHMDCLHWVNRDSYLPQGQRGLKAVTKAKLGYDPVEVAPEDMVRLAAETPQAMASYSVSDAVATYYLYMTYIHPFIFSLATIIPMPPDEVLRKGSGTLCEQLLMVEAYRANVVCPNKHISQPEVLYKHHLLESETYIGGKVEALESGVFRSDLPTRFKCKGSAYQGLIDCLDRDLSYAIKHDGGWELSDVANYEEVKAEIIQMLEALRDAPNREEVPLIYHLDVAAMYPNIILTNRLQPSAIVTDEDCAACDFNKPGKTCLRQMEWVWRGEHYACSHSEYLQVKRQLMAEMHGGPAAAAAAGGEGGPRSWAELSLEEQGKLLKERLKKYTQKVYKRVLDKPVVEKRTAGICQRENAFYIDTVRAFRDRRYEYKGLNKKWKGKLDAAKRSGNALATAEAGDMVVLYDSLQLAHKCILNSFYGYVMRKGARWYSMEMAGVVTNTGAKIIQRACGLVEQIGKPLELDTDGIWCCLPGSFPENFEFKHATTGKGFKISYPCVMLNVMVAEHNTNDQYQTLVDPVRHIYESSSQMSIEFEVDGPYKAMILPASKEEGKLIKKRYAVFNFDGSLAELKGFEIKRRGELKLIKVFQAEVFEQFLAGSSLTECYDAVAAVANRWLDMLDTQGVDLTDDELMEYISESTTMSKAMEEYGDRKSCAITTAKRLAAFLGDERIKDKGLSCTYIIACRPENQATSERAIPCSIFSAEPPVARAWLRKWCGDLGSGASDSSKVPDVRDILDWDYYRERLGNAIQKIITIPAAMQHVTNPVPRVKHPDWLIKRVRERDSKSQQLLLTDMFKGAAAKAQQEQKDGAAAAADEGVAGGVDSEADSDDSNPCAAPPAPKDVEDLFGGARAADQGKAAAAGRRGRARVIIDDADDEATGAGNNQATAAAGAGAGADDMQLDQAVQADHRQQPGGVQDKQRQRQQQQQGAEVGPMPDRLKDYGAWLSWQKQRWRSGLQERKRQKVAAGRRQQQAAAEQEVPQVLPTSNVGRFFRQQQAVATHSHWQLLQLAASPTPGVFSLWALVDNALYCVPLRVGRVVVVNSDAGLQHTAAAHILSLGGNLQQCRAVLPPGDEAKHLDQIIMCEPEWQSAATRLGLQLMSAGARGLYQAQLPLQWAASLDLGCVVSVTHAARNRTLGDGFGVHELQARTVAECSYLEGDGPDGLGPSLRHVALYVSTDGNRGRSVYCLLLPATKQCLLVVVVPSGIAAKEVNASIMDKSWRELLANLGSQGILAAEAAAALSSCEFTVEYARQQLQALRLVQRALAAYKEAQRGPCVATVQCPGGSARLQQDMPLLGDMPCVDKPVAAEDGRYPALQWQLRAARRALAGVAAAGPWLRNRVGLTRYAHVPLAGLGRDALMSIADVLLSRRLREAGHMLWTADPALPDLGIEKLCEEDVLLLDDSPRPQMSAPGCYRGVCVSLKLHHLAVAAVDTAAQLAELSGALTLEGLLGPAAATFKRLRELVQSWLTDATQNSSVIADSLLKQLYHWVSNPSSAVHHPQLHKALLGLMRRLFVVLVEEMKRLGATVVAANFNTVLIYTGRRNITAAVGYTRYLLDTLHKRELLTWLTLSPQRWWAVLHYVDDFNYGGVEATVSNELWEAGGVVPPPAAAAAADGSSDAEAAATASAAAAAEIDAAEIGTPGGPRLSQQWNLVEFLPRALHQQMQLLLAEWMYLPWQEANRVAAQPRGASQGGSQATLDTRQAEQIQVEYLREAVGGRWGDKVMTRVSSILRHVPPGSTHPDCMFPQRAGSHLTQDEVGSPALAFVRLLVHLLALDVALEPEVRLLCRALLRLVGVDEFSPAVNWVDPCISFKLHDVICCHCNDCRELDLCRDEVLQQGNWDCPSCGAPYDKGAIEARLVAALQARLREYTLQDLTCTKCKQVTSSRLSSNCTACGAALGGSISPAAAHTRLVVFRNLASFHGFSLLQQLADLALHDGQQQQQQPSGNG